MVKEWFTIKELAEKTNIPDTSVRRYIDKFHEFFIFKGGARSKRYEDTAVKILIRIKNLFDSGFESDDVAATLRNEFAMVVDGDNDPEQVGAGPLLVTAEDLIEIKLAQQKQEEMNKVLLEKLEKQEEFNKLLLQQLQHQEQHIKESLEKRDQLLLESIRTMQEEKKLSLEVAAALEQKQEEKKGFFARLFGSK